MSHVWGGAGGVPMSHVWGGTGGVPMSHVGWNWGCPHVSCFGRAGDVPCLEGARMVTCTVRSNVSWVMVTWGPLPLWTFFINLIRSPAI